MPSPLSLDLRQRVLNDFHNGLSFAELGRKYSVSAEWVRRFIRRHQATGEVAARPQVMKKLPFHRRHEVELRAAVAENPSLTLEGLRAKLGLEVSIGTLWTALTDLKLSFKKKRSSPRSGLARTSRPSGPSSTRSRPPASTRTASSSSTRPG